MDAMQGRLRRFLGPADTSSTDAFTWTDKRPIREQIASGFRKAGGLIAGGVVMIGSLVALGVISSDQPARNTVVAWTALAVGTIIMIASANRWAPYGDWLLFRTSGTQDSGCTTCRARF